MPSIFGNETKNQFLEPNKVEKLATKNLDVTPYQYYQTYRRKPVLAFLFKAFKIVTK